ncbi:hypothetical protein E3P99_02570 [Wallemia hederae]|uniref:Uncharacterized protein n=1 Tax=Wallemia hederae TaxID=1540922 RepID=A0A4T0FJM5_9BASI|nr:hypothetical protein E3P99_02570 [Wallemia hederae]
MSTAEKGATNDQGFVNGDNNANANVSRFITPGGHPADSSQPAFPIFHRKIANPSPLGLFDGFRNDHFHALVGDDLANPFSLTPPTVSTTSRRAVSAHQTSSSALLSFTAVSVSSSRVCGSSPPVTPSPPPPSPLTAVSGCECSYGVIYIPWFGIESAYAGAEEELASALGIYLIGWFIGEYFGREEREYAR